MSWYVAALLDSAYGNNPQALGNPICSNYLDLQRDPAMLHILGIPQNDVPSLSCMVYRAMGLLVQEPVRVRFRRGSVVRKGKRSSWLYMPDGTYVRGRTRLIAHLAVSLIDPKSNSDKQDNDALAVCILLKLRTHFLHSHGLADDYPGPFPPRPAEYASEFKFARSEPKLPSISIGKEPILLIVGHKGLISSFLLRLLREKFRAVRAYGNYCCSAVVLEDSGKVDEARDWRKSILNQV